MIRSIQPGDPLSGTIPCPGDKSISHRYAMLAALAEGKSELRNFAGSMDCRSTLRCLRGLGVEIDERVTHVSITGAGMSDLRAPGAALDAGNSGTTMRLLSGILAGQPFQTVLSGDASLCRRPMGRIMTPLRQMGARISSAAGDLPPLQIHGGSLRAIRYSLPVASAQVKSCILLAGLFADGVTAVQETVPTRDHTEIALQHFGATMRHKGDWIEVEPARRLDARQLEIPGDLSGAAFFIVAAALVPGSDILLPGVGLNPRRRALIDYLKEAGVKLSVENESHSAGEARGDLRVIWDPAALDRRPPPIRGEWTAALIDEIPVLAVYASQAGGLEIHDAAELRVKESDRIDAIAANLRAMGAVVEEYSDGLAVPGRQRLRGAEIDTRSDHRIAMAFAVAGLAATGETRVHEAECADVSFPGFYEILARVQHP